jgi:hypothetical protein
MAGGMAYAAGRRGGDQYDEPQQAPPPARQPPAPAAGASDTEELQRLADLHASGALTDDEFAAAKANLLGV